ncbi:uncharacterized protein F5147DRAFT_783158 [Suillus discolor]|uniref:F-box domain-containing protein n=1 Tax=Suillus discolor TaxID=1912936 RepID=A0A9P7ERT4_9AGAM|nr:uncharacterized protein F5147DRAFT_783158 [Suillus discolor]KAG2082842.1 hypothetical protein F5147DRAFT_783158 [Suillus discolor]
MHRALLVSEILVQILINLSKPPGSEIFGWSPSSTRKSLASLALTCTTFHELAMDFLWSNMHGLRPLLGCVTRLHPVIYDPESKYSWSQYYADPLAEHEFHQFLRHSARVRHLIISASNYFRLLTALPIETRVFPNLRSLSWLVQRTEIGDLRFFLPPTLRCCSVSEVPLDMKYIGARCPDMEEFTVHEDSDMAQLSETLRSCKRLRRLQCPPFDSAAWMHLSTIPTLLEVKISTPRTIHYPLDNLNFATFLRLTSLSLCGIEVASAVAIIQHSKFPSLKEFEMHVRVLPWAEAEQLFRALSLCKASQTLESIKISSRNRTQEHTSDSLTAVKQFLCFKELRTLGLSVHYPIYLDDDLLFEAMTTWPHIHSFQLMNWYPSPATLTFRGLFAALRLCPQLQDLQVSIDARNIDIEPEVESFQHTSLNNLIIDSRELETVNVEAVARIIYYMLPAVSQVVCSNGGVPQLWYDVNKHLDMLRNKPYSAPEPCITEAALALS